MKFFFALQALGVLLVILIGCTSDLIDMEDADIRGPRHFNRALGMRPLKPGIFPRGFRTKGAFRNGHY